jgi:hypothetical protein
MRGTWAIVLLGLVFGAGCSSPVEEIDATEEVDEMSSAQSKKCKVVSEFLGDVLTPKEIAALLRDADFPEADIAKMVCVAAHESRFHAGAHRINENCTHDNGLFQINSYWWSETCGASAEELMDPATNARCAKVVRERDKNGMRAWYAYRSHQRECNAYKIPE